MSWFKLEEEMGAPAPTPPSYKSLRVIAQTDDAWRELRDIVFLSGANFSIPRDNAVTGQHVVEERGVIPIYSEIPLIPRGMEVNGTEKQIQKIIGRCEELKLAVALGEPW